MTVMGKILVILNLVAALLVGGFLVYDFGTRSNWKAATDQAQQETAAARANAAAEKVQTKKVQGDLALVVAERDRLKGDLVKQKKDLQDEVDKLKDEIGKLADQIKQSQAVAVASKAEAARLREEVKLHIKGVEDRDKTILTQEARLKTLLDRAVAAENNVNSLKARNSYMVEQLELAGKKLARLESGGGKGTSGRIGRDPNAKNPPAAFVRGVVTDVVRSRGLVEISLGSDEGVNKDNTLEVYRLRPKPEYLGTIRILEAHHHKAVGVIMKAPSGIRRGAVVKGDEVASKIMDR